MVQSCQVSALQIPTARPSHGGLRHGSGLWRTERAPPSARGRRSGHLGVVCLVAQYCAKYPCYPPSDRYQQHARPRARVLAPASGAVVPSERPWATRRSRSGGIRAPWTVQRRAGRSSAPAGSCHRAVGCVADPGTCAACAARARLWRRASTTWDDPSRQPHTAPPRPTDASRSPPIAGGEVELALPWAAV